MENNEKYELVEELTSCTPPSLLDTCVRFIVNKSETPKLELLPTDLQQAIVACMDESVSSQRCSVCNKLYFHFFIELFAVIKQNIILEVSRAVFVQKLCSFSCLYEAEKRLKLYE